MIPMNKEAYNHREAYYKSLGCHNSMGMKYRTEGEATEKEEYVYLKSGTQLVPLLVFVKLDGELVPLQASLKG